jgi:hypothetical protein
MKHNFMNLTIKENLKINFDKTQLRINTKQDFSWKELIVYFFPAFIFFFFFNIVLSILISSLIFLTYFVFRVVSFIFYSEIIIDFEENRIIKNNFKGESLINSEILAKNIEVKNLHFKKIQRSGKIRYLLTYTSFKEISLVVIKEEEDFVKINSIFESNLMK